MVSSAWFVLGFTGDEIVGAGQDWRLADACVRAWNAAGRPPGFSILQSGGTGEHMVFWFVNEVAARVLDAQSVKWRDRVIGSRSEPPIAARNALKTNVSGTE